MRSLVASLAVAFVLSGCGASEPEVDWETKYSPSVKKRLDDLVKEKDCNRLLAELDTAHAIDGAKDGGSDDLVAYVRHALDRADCKTPNED